MTNFEESSNENLKNKKDEQTLTNSKNINTKNKKNNSERIELNKHCRFCRKHTLHKETK